jgi:hypothetical protein
MIDKRKAAWILTEEAAMHIRECFKSDSALFAATQVNAKTGSKIINRVPVKKDMIKDFTVTFLDFLTDVYSGRRSIDVSRHHESDIRTAYQFYLIDGEPVTWRKLAVQISDTEQVASTSQK